MDFQEYLQARALEINQELKNFLKDWEREVKVISPRLVHLYKAFTEASDGGKRLRGVLVKLGYEIAQAQNSIRQPADKIQKLKLKLKSEEIIKIGVAYEIYQTAILAHDDVIDKSPTRRGKPTIYQALGGDHYAVSQTICLGDIGFYLANKLITDSKFPPENKNLALSYFNQVMMDTAWGEILDVELPHLNGSYSEKDILTIFKLKTAQYTIIGPLKLGAILGGANKSLLDSLDKFGQSLGVAFQIQDDILGVFGDEKTIGKSATSDIEEGKVTLLILFARQHANKAQSKILDQYYGKGPIGQEEHERIKQVFIDTGALNYSQNLAEDLVKKAKKIIPLITNNHEIRTLLDQMADFLVERNK